MKNVKELLLMLLVTVLLVSVAHYWMEDTTPVIQEKNVVCLDYSVAKRGSLVGYRWHGEHELDTKNLVRVKYNEVSE